MNPAPAGAQQEGVLQKVWRSNKMPDLRMSFISLSSPAMYRDRSAYKTDFLDTSLAESGAQPAASP
jgi:hypothetical protein